MTPDFEVTEGPRRYYVCGPSWFADLPQVHASARGACVSGTHHPNTAFPGVPCWSLATCLKAICDWYSLTHSPGELSPGPSRPRLPTCASSGLVSLSSRAPFSRTTATAHGYSALVLRKAGSGALAPSCPSRDMGAGKLWGHVSLLSVCLVVLLCTVLGACPGVSVPLLLCLGLFWVCVCFCGRCA
jgi:hypothetical protein